MKQSLKNKRSILLTVLLILASFWVQAQKTTELFIPCGKSPGVSGKYSVLGKVETIRVSDSTVTIRQNADVKSIRLTAATDIYLDKSKLKQQSKKGTWADIKPGLTAEVKYVDNKAGAPCEWIKLEIL